MRSSLFNGYSVNLVESEADFLFLKDLVERSKTMIGVDTETTGLSYVSDKIVGCCISVGLSYSKTDYSGYYLPIRHVSGNLDESSVFSLIDYILNNKRSVFWNRDFDVFHLENEGVHIPFVGGMHDAQKMMHLVMGEHMPALKVSARNYLKWDMLDFSTNNAEGNNFGNTDPQVSYVYAAGDPLATVMVARKIWSEYPYIRKIYPLDNRATEAVRRLSKSLIYMDKDVVQRELDSAKMKLASLQDKIFAFTGYPFKLNSNVDKADALSRFVTLTVKTKKDKYKVDEETLSKLNHPLADMMVEYATIQKSISSYLSKMADFPNPFRCSYSTCNVPCLTQSAIVTVQNKGRISIKDVKQGDLILTRFGWHEVVWNDSHVSDDLMCVNLSNGTRLTGTSYHPVLVYNECEDFEWKFLDQLLPYDQVVCLNQDNSLYFCDVVSTSTIPGSDVVYDIEVSDVHEFVANGIVTHNTGRLSSGGQSGNDYYASFNIQNVPKEDSTLFVHEDPQLGQVLSFEEEGSLGTVKVKSGLRSAFVPPKGFLWVTVDFVSQEMVLMANFSKDPLLTQPILEGKDIHNHVAKTMFGYEDPSHRTKVKVVNFAVNYGGNEYTISKRLSIPVEEAKSLIDLYNKTLRRLTDWKDSMKKDARRKGMVFTYFGRPRVLYKYYNSSDRGLHAFADRSAVNSPVQGCMPLYSYVETEDSVVPMSISLGKRFLTKDKRSLIPVHLGKSDILLCVFRSGDFIVCDFNHQFVKGSLISPQVDSLRSGLKSRVHLSPLHSKKRPSLRYLFKSSSKSVAYLRATLKFNKEIKNNNRIIAAAFWKLAFSRRRFPLTPIEMSRIRSLGSIYGFNVLSNRDGSLFHVVFTRRKRTKLKFLKSLYEEGHLEEVGSCTVLQGFQLYPTQGFLNKNTGGDLIRISICKLMDKLEEDSEFAANVIPVLTVHDEIDFCIRPSYLYKGTQLIKEIMEFHPSNFIVPLTVSVAVGSSWGSCADVKSISPDNKISYL